MDINEFLEKNIDNMKADLASLVKYNSVFSEDAEPFGTQNRLVLDEALKLMQEKGLKTTNLDYYCGYGEAGEGNKLVGILAHLDIVPVGEGWESDPFTVTEKDGVLYGRGVSDDKGAAVASMYALKYLIDEKYPFKKRVRLILGCNEETGSLCVRHYVKNDEAIDYGFTPDGNFPGIYAEKGMIGGKIIGHNSKIIDIDGGEASNVVNKKVTAKLPLNSFDIDKLKAFLDKNNIKYDIDIVDVINLTVYGVAAHASTPDLGVNAINYMFEALYEADFNDSFINFFHRSFGLTLHGELLGYGDVMDDISDTTINFGVAKKRGNDIIVSLDMRFPVKSNSDKCYALLEKCEDEENEFALGSKVEPLYFDQNSPMIKALKKAYVDVTGDTVHEMEAIGGGTYAKAINNCIAFGCEFQYEQNHIHDVNEKLAIDSFKKQVEIYVEAIKNLNEIED